MNIGIVSYGLYTPAAFDTTEDVAAKSGMVPDDVLKLGIEKKCRPDPLDQPVVMAAKAAGQALERARGLNPEDVDVVIWTGEEYKDYVAQTPSIRLQEEIGCRDAWAFDLVGQGVTTLQGLRTARDLITGDDRIRTVLLAGGTRNVDLVNPTNPDTRFLLAASASGGAVILQQGHNANLLLDTAYTVDCKMADEVYVPGGGTEIPFALDNLSSDSMFYQTPRPEVVANYLKDRWTGGLCGVARRVLDNSTLDYLALRHLSRADRATVLDLLGLAPEQSAPLYSWGDHGTNDVLISLDLGLKSGAIQDGSLVAMVAAGIGFTYAAALIQWGAAK